MELVSRFATPEVLGLLATLAALLLVKSKIFTERDYKKAKEILDVGLTATQAAMHTRLKVEEVEREIDIAREGDSNSKKVQRAARKIIRGWLRF